MRVVIVALFDKVTLFICSKAWGVIFCVFGFVCLGFRVFTPDIADVGFCSISLDSTARLENLGSVAYFLQPAGRWAERLFMCLFNSCSSVGFAARPWIIRYLLASLEN